MRFIAVEPLIEPVICLADAKMLRDARSMGNQGKEMAEGLTRRRRFSGLWGLQFHNLRNNCGVCRIANYILAAVKLVSQLCAGTLSCLVIGIWVACSSQRLPLQLLPRRMRSFC